MDKVLKEFLSEFTGTFKEFLMYIHFFYQKKIDSENKKIMKDKYIKTRHGVLKFAIANEKSITQELSKRNTK